MMEMLQNYCSRAEVTLYVSGFMVWFLFGFIPVGITIIMYFAIDSGSEQDIEIYPLQNFTCYEEIESVRWIEYCYFWIRGMSSIFVATVGIFANTAAFFVFKRLKTNRSFDRLLMCLCKSFL